MPVSRLCQLVGLCQLPVNSTTTTIKGDGHESKPGHLKKVKETLICTSVYLNSNVGQVGEYFRDEIYDIIYPSSVLTRNKVRHSDLSVADCDHLSNKMRRVPKPLSVTE